MSDTSDSATKQYKDLRLTKTSDGMFDKMRADLEPLHEHLEDGWEVHTFAFGEDGFFQRVMLVKDR